MEIHNKEITIYRFLGHKNNEDMIEFANEDMETEI